MPLEASVLPPPDLRASCRLDVFPLRFGHTEASRLPSSTHPGTVTITLRIPRDLKEQLKWQAESRGVSLSRLIRDRLEEHTQVANAALHQRLANPLRGSPRRRPRDSAALLALAWTTRQKVLRDTRFVQTGPRSWKLV